MLRTVTKALLLINILLSLTYLYEAKTFTNNKVENKIRISKLFRFLVKPKDEVITIEKEAEKEEIGELTDEGNAGSNNKDNDNKTEEKEKKKHLGCKICDNLGKKAENYQELADSIMNFVFENYPDYKIPLLTQTMFNRSKHMAYTGFVMEVQPPLGDYRLVFTDSYRKQGNEINKRIEEYPTAHRCTNAIRYCSSHPTYCEYQEGSANSKFIITVSHGGSLIPTKIKKLAAGCFLNGVCVYNQSCLPDDRNAKLCPVFTRRNIYSKEIGILLRDYLESMTGIRPHLIMMNLHSSLIDVDEYIDRGAINDIKLKSVWYDYHTFIADALLKTNGQGLLLDISTHINNDALVELDYGLDKVDKFFNFDAVKSTLDSLRNHVSISPYDLVYGKNSLGYFLQNKYIEAKPSPRFSYINESMTSSNYSIHKLYGSFYGGSIDSIKIDVPKKYYEAKYCEEFVRKLSESLVEFFTLNYKNKGVYVDPIN